MATKRATTKDILAESFRELAETRPVDKITIQEIVDNCGYSTATFYRQFQDKYDLIAWDYVHRTSGIMDKVGKEAYHWKNTLFDGMEFFLKNKRYIQNLLQHTSGHNAFVRYMSETNIRYLTDCILKLSGKRALDPDTEVYVRMYCFGTIRLTCEWLLDELDCDGNHLAELFEQALPLPLRGILCD